MKDKHPWLPWVLAALTSITSISFHFDAKGVRIELQRTQQQLAEAQSQDNFSLASACEQQE